MKVFNNLDFGGVAKIVNLPSPTGDSDLVNKGYVQQLLDTTLAGFDFQSDVDAVQVDDTLDLTSVTVGQRFIITNIDSLPTQLSSVNGLEVGDIVVYDGTSFSVAYDVSTKGDGVFVYSKAEKEYYRYVNSVWNVASVGTVSAGSGLAKADNELSVKYDNTTVGLNVGGELEVKDGSITTAKLSPAIVLPQKKAQSVGDGATLEFTITHNFNTKDVIVQAYEAATGATASVESIRTTLNDVKVTFDVAPTTDQIRVVIIG